MKLLYGTTPPRLGTRATDVAAAADKLAARLKGLPLDAVVVYDIQDETGRTQLPRPFPFVGTVDPRVYARLLAARCGLASRLLAKAKDGCRYFVSQAVYHAPPTVALLGDYLRECREAGIDPRPIVLTFAPCGRQKTLAFIRWLGVHVAPETERAILSAASPLAKSIEICRDSLRRILDQPYREAIPLGVNVESVSIYRDEIDATIDLFHVLKEELQGG